DVRNVEYPHAAETIFLHIGRLRLPLGGRRYGSETLRTAIEPAVRHLDRHEEQVPVNGDVALPARTHQRGQQTGLRRVRNVVDVDAVKISLEHAIALEREVGVGECELGENQLETLRHL